MNENLYKQSIMESPVGYAYHKIICNDEGIPEDYVFIEINPAFEEYTGLKSSDIIGKKVTDIFPNFRKGSFDWIKTYGEVALNGEIVEFEEYSEPIQKWCRIKAYSPEKNYFITFHSDVSQKKNQEMTLEHLKETVKETEVKYTAVADYAYDWEVWLDEKGVLQYVSPACEKTSGYTAKEFLENMFLFDTIILDEDRSIWEEHKWDVISHKEAHAIRFRIRNKDGQVVWIEHSCNQVIDKNSMLLGQRACNRDITKYKQAAEALQANQRKLKDIIEFLPDATLGIDQERRIIIWNKAIEKMTGIPASEMLGKGDYEYTIPFYGRKQSQMMDLIFEDNEDIRMSYANVSRDGDTLSAEAYCPALYQNKGAWIYVKVSPLYDPNGNVIGAIECIRDITENKQRISELNSKTAFLEAQTNASNDGIMVVDEKGERILMNRRYKELFDVPKKVLDNKDDAVMLDYFLTLAKEPEKLLKKISYLYCHRNKVSREELEMKNGMVMDRHSAPVMDKEGKYYGRIWTFHDITDRKRLEIALAKEKNILETTLISVGDGVISTDNIGNIVFMNRAAEILTGWSQEEARGQSIEDVYHIIREGTCSDSENIIKKVLESGKVAEQDNNTLLISKDGKKRFIEDSVAPIRDEKGVTYGVVLVFRDNTEKKYKQEEIKYLSYHDQLTGLYNRRFYAEEIRRLDKKRNLPLTIVMGDVNGLKLVNDSFGHTKGDELLQVVAEVLKKGCRADDVIARIGGDEFVILLPKTDALEAERIIKRITALALEERAGSIETSISFGYCTKVNATDDIQEVLKNSEDQMYRHKLFESLSMRSKTIDLIMNTLFEKSKREMLHSKRVSEICGEIAIAMGFDEDDVNQIRLVGLMHDIGKIGIDETILNNPQKLNSDEWHEMKRHSEVGYRILSSVNEFSEIASFVLEHHEQWDGKGYPRNLKNIEISIQARIIAVADAFDAMTSERPYRNTLSEGKALTEIQKQTGKQFDPEIVQIFIERVLNKKKV